MRLANTKRIILVSIFCFLSAIDSLTTTLALEDFNSYTHPLSLTDGHPNGYPELNLGLPMGVFTWTTEGYSANGNAAIVNLSLNNNYLEMNNTGGGGGGQYDAVISFSPIVERFVYLEFRIKAPVGGKISFRLEDENDLDGGSANIEGTTLSHGSKTSAITTDAWHTIKMFADQQNTSCSNNACLDVYLDHNKVGTSPSNFAYDWAGKTIAKLTFSNRDPGTYLVDDIRIYKSTTAPDLSDTTAPLVNPNIGNSILSSTNPNLQLSFSDTGGALDFIQYRFNSALGGFKNFTNDGATSIGTDLSGVSYSPSSIKISDIDFASISVGSSALIYVRVQDHAGNINAVETQITLHKTEANQNKQSLNAIAYPNLINLNQTTTFNIKNLLSNTTIQIVDLNGVRYFYKSTNTKTYSINIASDFIFKPKSGLYFILVSSQGQSKKIKLIVLR